ncbi:unnamed protein product [Ceratitis capitata]|uniref:(Mediterranean fruit fly) hypothetical protein n=1 Tax=Ceratitis capitata TaxID=7213 RepID=A0A811UHH3_CERCA|nr:unnamed protein product [Ceratitis capitata]
MGTSGLNFRYEFIIGEMIVMQKELYGGNSEATQRLRSERFCRKLNIPTRKAKVSQQTTAQKQADCRAGQVFARFRWAVLVRYKLARGVTKQADESVFLKLTVPLCE